MTDNPTPVPPTPPRYESPPLGFADQHQLQQAHQRNNKALWGIFGLLMVLTVGVVFVLPSMVQPVAPPAVAVATPTTATAPAAQAETPFAEAQRLRQRQEAQDALAPLLALQETMEKQQVARWAVEDYKEVLATAQQGDQAYGVQQFAEATALYQQALAVLQGISSRTTEIFSARMQEGTAALSAGNAAAADAAFSVAILLDPNSSDAVAGLERARVLDRVIALTEEGDAFSTNGNFADARDRYRQAIALDPAHTAAEQALASLATTEANQNFSAVMSRGFAALQAGNAETAKSAFEQAAALRPGSDEVAAALQQANDQQTLGAITVEINKATAAEANEDWALALAAWNAALVIDPNLVTAQEGQRRTQSRSNLDEFLTATIANPLRLGEADVYEQTTQVVNDATRLLSPTPRLQNQLQQVREFMTRVKAPVTVTLNSDGMTNVTVYGIGEFGLLTSKTLSLTPGNYVAVGVRAGYRDARQEFVVGLDGQAVQVTVTCSDAI